MSRYRVGVVLKTAAGGMWIIPQVKALREWAEVVVVIPQGEGRLSTHLADLAEDDPGLVVHRTSYRFSFVPRLSNAREFIRFARELRHLDLDAVLYHLYASALATRFALIGSRTRRVQMVAGPLHLESPIIRTFERILLHADHAIIGGSEDIRRRYLELGANPSRLSAIPYGVDTQNFTPSLSAEAARSALDIPKDAFVVVMVAFVYAPKRLVHAGKGIKGHAELLAAWSEFAARHPDARLLIVGGGFHEAGESYRQQLIASLPAPLSAMGVTWYDTVDDVQTIYAAANLSVSPSLSENHGAALEASAMGVPSIVSDAGGLPETVEAGRSGWVVEAGSASELGEALDQAHASWEDGTLVAMGRGAREIAVTKFDSSVAASSVAAVVMKGLR